MQYSYVACRVKAWELCQMINGRAAICMEGSERTPAPRSMQIVLVG